MINKEQLENIIKREASSAFTILRIEITGSAVFKGLDNLNNDLDIRVICDNDMADKYLKAIYKDNDYKYDIMIYRLDYYEQLLKFEIDDRRAIYNYFHYWDIPLYGDDLDIEWDIFDYKIQYKKLVEDILKSYPYFYPDKKTTWVNEKMFVHAFAATKILENKEIKLTDTIKNKILELYNRSGHDAIE